MQTIALDYALAEWLLNEYPYSYIHEALIFNKIEELYKTKQYNGQRISYIKRDTAPDAAFRDKISSLRLGGFIKPVAHYIDSSFYAIPSKPEYPPEGIVCAIYPFGYLSHISAMMWHNITHKNPKTVRFTVPSRVAWKKNITELITSSSSAGNNDVRMLIPYPSSGKHLGFELEVSQEGKYTDPMKVRGSPIRVSSIAKTFLDMTRHPFISGGIDHVIDVYEEHGPKFAKQIINFVDKSGTKIDRARVGFLLKEVARISNPRLDIWMEEARPLRGGSRVMNPDSSFEPFYSPDWSLSLNVEKLYKYGKHN